MEELKTEITPEATVMPEGCTCEAEPRQLQEDCPVCEDQRRFRKFLDRLHMPHSLPKLLVRKWMAIAGIVLLVALIVAYYLTTGGR